MLFLLSFPFLALPNPELWHSLCNATSRPSLFSLLAFLKDKAHRVSWIQHPLQILTPTSTFPSQCYWRSPWQSRHHSKCITPETELVLSPCMPAPLLTHLCGRKVAPFPQGQTAHSSPVCNQLPNLINSSSEVPLTRFLSISATTPQGQLLMNAH